MSGMTHRERVLKALNHQEPDGVPIDLSGTTASMIVFGAYERLKRYLAIDSETLFMDTTSGRVVPDEEILRRFDIDTRMLLLQPPVKGSKRMELPGSYEDQWGIVWQLTSDGRYYAVKVPFAGQPSISDLLAHSWPDPDAPRLSKAL
jgi:uroporphyrinogen decarboxylase